MGESDLNQGQDRTNFPRNTVCIQKNKHACMAGNLITSDVTWSWNTLCFANEDSIETAEQIKEL